MKLQSKLQSLMDVRRLLCLKKLITFTGRLDIVIEKIWRSLWYRSFFILDNLDFNVDNLLGWI